MSNLLGFCVAVLGNVDWRSHCKPVSADASRVVWDSLGPVGSRKNRQFGPKLHACEECKAKHHITQPQFPPILSSIRPAQQGTDFFEATDATPGLPVPVHMLSTCFS